MNASANLLAGHRERLKERFRNAYGAGSSTWLRAGMHDYEVLELLLTYAIPRKDVKPIAKNLMARFKTLNGVLDASVSDIESMPDMGAHSATLIKLVGLPHEAFMVIFMNLQNEVLAHEIVSEGTVDQVAVYPRRILEKALGQHAAGLIIVHNHPSGYTDPSEDDKHLTRSLKEAAKLLSIRLLDHIIVGQNGHFSFLERGLI
jgi:DNA repair protein RadC